MEKETANLFGGGQWKGKLWYAYGTSITSTSYGEYVPIIQKFSGMQVKNFGRPGEGIGDFGAVSTGVVYRDLTTIADHKEDADLITIEIGANDIGPDTPIGDEYDHDESTLCGRLNLAVEFLQSHTYAQIVLIASPSGRWRSDEYREYGEAQWKFRKIAFLHRVYWIDGNSCLGYGRIAVSMKFVSDFIHQTSVGAYNYALSIWKELKEIPLFYRNIPE